MGDLLKINVSEHTEKKNGLTYLSWAWAWAEVLKIDPQATWEAVEFNGFPASFAPDRTALVKTVVTINGHAKSCWLPVMDHRNKAIEEPNAFQINTAIVRCLTKCISMHGLGLYIYAGEDLPEADKPEPEKPKKRGGVVSDYLETVTIAKDRTDALDELALTVIDDHQSYGVEAAYERIDMEALQDDEKVYLWSKLPSNVRSAIKAHSQSLHKKETA